MYIDLFLLVLVVLAVVFFFKRFSSFVYLIASLDIFFRILHFIKNNVNVPELSALIGKYFPSSMPSIINKYTSGVINQLVMWCYVILYMILLFYIVRILWKRK